ncbi:MAG: aromatic ring-hydroxylating dioxygenase subunit alpha [Aquisalimonadaceae bacterium]
MLTNEEIRKLVDVETGDVARKIFVDPDVYQQELARIFGRCWLYVGHESQFKNNGDFITTYMGEDPVIVIRDGAGKINVLLNSCRHRGMKVCRKDEGNARSFVCSYHGWSFSNSGELLAVPREEVAYCNGIDKGDLGLLRPAQVDTLHGMIFANWDPDAPSLNEYLGDMKFYLDLMADRMEGGIELIGGVHKWIIDGNWKLAADNFVGDMYHVPVTHGSAVGIGIRKPWGDDGYQISPGNGHGFGGEFGGLAEGEGVATPYTPFIKKVRENLEKDKGDYVSKIVPIGHGTVFPNFSFLDTMRFRTFRVWHPKGPNKMEIQAWCVVDKALPDELKAAVRQQYIFTFGPSGVFEQEDGENWSQCTAAAAGWRGRQDNFNYSMGLGREREASEVLGHDLPGKIGGMWSEINQRAMYRRWRDLMAAESWSDLA